MKRASFLLFLIVLLLPAFSQVFPEKDYPILFRDAQMSNVFSDSKTFPDCIPLVDVRQIDSCYITEKALPGFNLKDFVGTYFLAPFENSYISKIDTSIAIENHINLLWNKLTNKLEKSEGTLLYLPYSYVKPGGRFREIYYWDSYFTMLGLYKQGKTNLVENMVDNFAYLIDTYGFVPNGNRTYYLSRSQPPFFSLMVELLSEIKGKKVYTKYLPQLEKEYSFWMNGKDSLNAERNTFRRVVLLPDGEILNRYWDDNPNPRPEAYKEDIMLAKLSPEPDSVDYRNIRAACESGWDFSSRWLKDGVHPETIETTNILPVDLNSLLYNLENTIGKAYQFKGDVVKSSLYFSFANLRKEAINKYFWNRDEGFFVDYQFVLKWHNVPINLSGMYPLFLNIATNKQAERCADIMQSNFLSAGGLVTTKNNSGQQWDAPNGWAPLQYICVKGLENYHLDALANTITIKWLDLNRKVFKETGKLLEKYNVEDINVPGGGGEYPTQDGFGWTNGVFVILRK